MGNWDVDKAKQTLVKYGFNDNDGNVLDYSRKILKSAVWLALDEQRELIDAAVDILCGEPSEDAISRQTVLDGLASIAKAKAKSDAQKSLMGRTMFFVEHLPSCTPKHKVGKWIYHMETWPTSWYRCSICGGEEERTSNYCPNCGAKMEE